MTHHAFNFCKRSFAALFTGLFFLPVCGFAQVLAPVPVPIRPGDTLNQQHSIQKNTFLDTAKLNKRPGHAAFLFGVAELAPFTFDHFIRQAPVYDISLKSIGHNLSIRNWAFDNDPFETNQFGHPYHGNMFFNAYRTNGYTFWQSVPAPFIGSYLWETLAETQAPAPNDFINTSFGGVILGEMTFRLSNRVVDNRAVGFKRQVSEVLGLLINPMRGLNRIVNGKWGKYSANSKERDSSKIYAEFDLGARKIGTSNGKGNFGLFGHAKLLYGTPYEDYRTPFSNILIDAEAGKDDSATVNMLSVYGSLAGWEVIGNDRVEQLAILSLNYDYIDNQSFFYGAQSVKINLVTDIILTKKIRINLLIATGPIILGAAPDIYLTNGRNYDYGSGAAFNFSAGIKIGGKFFYNAGYRNGWLKTINGNASHYFLHVFSNEIGFQLVRGFSLIAAPGYFTLHGYYQTHPSTDKTYSYLRVSARYSLNL